MKVYTSRLRLFRHPDNMGIEEISALAAVHPDEFYVEKIVNLVDWEKTQKNRDFEFVGKDMIRRTTLGKDLVALDEYSK